MTTQSEETHNPNSKIEEIRQKTADFYAGLTQLLDNQIVQLEPAKLYIYPADGEWSIMQLLAHINEIMPYWADEVEKLVAKPGQNFGRVMSDETRLKAVSDFGEIELNQARATLPTNYIRLYTVLSQLKDSDLALTGTHSRYGQRGLDWFIQEFVTGHLHNHLNQLRACVDTVQYLPEQTD